MKTHKQAIEKISTESERKMKDYVKKKNTDLYDNIKSKIQKLKEENQIILEV